MFGFRSSENRTSVKSQDDLVTQDGPDQPLPDDAFHALKQDVFVALLELIDAAEVLRLPLPEARSRISAALMVILHRLRRPVVGHDRSRLLDELCDDMLGFGPLERFLVRDDISDILVNGAKDVFIEVGGIVQKTDVTFRDNDHLMNICQRIVSLVGRRVDEGSPLCDARLKDGSRVNVVVPPLALDGPILTIRRFSQSKLTLDDLQDIGTVSPAVAEILRIIALIRCNVLISGGTGSGKTTLLNALTASIQPSERIATCEDTAELQLQQPHVVRMEARAANLEGKGEVSMFQLVRNCLRMRPDRIIVGEVRGPEAFDLLQAMNTGHDGSMGTLHANSPDDAVSRIESMVMMGFENLTSGVIHRLIDGSVDVIIHVARQRDGSRKVTHVSEVVGLKDGRAQLRDIVRYEFDNDYTAETDNPSGSHRVVYDGLPDFLERARLFGQHNKLIAALKAGAAPA
jgi:pilus assembly protein CpaF